MVRGFEDIDLAETTLESRDAEARPCVPKHLLVVGAGPAGMAAAQAERQILALVRDVQRPEHPVPEGEDEAHILVDMPRLAGMMHLMHPGADE